MSRKQRREPLSLLNYLAQSSVVIVSSLTVSYFVFPDKLYDFLFDFSDGIILPLLRNIEPELSHNLSLNLSRSLFRLKDLHKDDSILSTKVMGLSFSNPIGLAAGFDKNGIAIGGLLDLGFSFVEVGSVTPKEQPGNPKPRVFRLSEDNAVINRYGFNSFGMEFAKNQFINFLNSRSTFRTGLVGLNAGKNKETPDELAQEDFSSVIETVGPNADYVVINLSSPNTPGLRDLQRTEAMSRIILTCSDARDRAIEKRSPNFVNLSGQYQRAPVLPLLVKLSPDLSETEKKCIAELLLQLHSEGKIDGIIISNTTITRPSHLKSKEVNETGGLSGAPVKDISTRLIGEMYILTRGQIPIIGVGGVGNGQDAFEKITAGASLVQMYTMLAYNGPGTVKRTKNELKTILEAHGYRSVEEAVGARVKSKIQSLSPENQKLLVQDNQNNQ